MPKKYKVLITGSGGMLGRDLCQELGESYDIAGMDSRAAGPRPAIIFFKGDITDKKRFADVVSDFLPDALIHTAAWTDVDGCELDRGKAYLVNSEGTKNAALACAGSKTALIYISTDFVFDGRKRGPYRETDRPRPLSVYGDSKLRGELFVKKYLRRYFIVRTSWLYGRHGRNFVDTILSKARSEKALKVVDDQAGSPTYTKDLARALHIILKKVLTDNGLRTRAKRSEASPKGTDYGTYHVSNSGSVTWFDYAKEILRLAGSKTKVLPISSKELDRPARRPAMSVLDNSKFAKVTGCRMRNWETALRDYLSSAG